MPGRSEQHQYLAGGLLHVGARESLVRGEGEQVIQWIDQLAARDAPVFNHKRIGRPLETGKPDADESRTSGLGRGGWKRAAR
jgi:hypothetical protein